MKTYLYSNVETSFEGLDTYRCQFPLSAINATNIAITGNGVMMEMDNFGVQLKKQK